MNLILIHCEFAVPPRRLAAGSLTAVLLSLLAVMPLAAAPDVHSLPALPSPLLGKVTGRAAAAVSLERARQLAEQGVEGLAEVELKKAVALAPQWVEAHRELARWYTTHQQWSEAAAAWRKVLYFRHGDGEALQQLELARRNAPLLVNNSIVTFGVSANNPASEANGPRTRVEAQTAPQLVAPTPAAPIPAPASAMPVPAPAAGTMTGAPLTTGANTPLPAPAAAKPKPAVKSRRKSNRRATKPVAAAAQPAARVRTVSKKRQAAAWPYVNRATRALKGRDYAAALTNYQRAYQLDPNNPYAQYGVAESQALLKRYVPAQQAYRRILAVRPNDSRALRGLADAYAFGADYQTAIPIYQRILQRNPRDFATMYQLGQVYAWNKSFDEAADTYRLALAEQPDNPTVWSALGEALTYGEEARARDAFSRALQLQPNNTRARLGLANLYSWNKEYPQAIAQYQALLAVQPNNEAGRIGLGDALTYSGHAPEAIEQYQKALLLNPASRAARLGLARAQVYAHRSGEGVAGLREVLRNQPNNQEALGLLAQALGSGDSPNVPQAIATYNTLLALQTDPVQQAATLGAIATLKGRQGDDAGARAAYEEALKRAPADANLAGDYASYLASTGDLPAAGAIIANALRVEPDNVRARTLEVVIQNKLGNKERATALAHQLAAIEPASPQDAILLANTLRTNGEAEAARRVLEKLAAQNANNPVVALQVANAVRDAGEWDAAVELYRKLLVGNPSNDEARLDMAEVLTWQKKYDAAQNEVNTVLAHDKDNVEAKVLLATIALRGETPESRNKAVQEANEVLRVDPNNVGGHLVLGEAMSSSQKFAEAVQQYQSVLKTDPNNLQARLGLARNLYYGRRVDDSIREYQELLHLAPNDNQVKLELARIYLDRNRLNDAETLFNQILESRRNLLTSMESRDSVTRRLNARFDPNLRPTSGRRHSSRGDVRFLLAAADTAPIDTASAVSDTTTTNANLTSAVAEQVAALRGLGEVRYRQQRYAESADYFNKALALDTTDVQARLGLARALRGQGDYVNALAQADKALALEPENLQGRVLHAQLQGDTGHADLAGQELDALVASLKNPTVDTYLVLAQAFTSLKGYDSAISLLEAAKQDFPNEPLVIRQIGETQTAAKRWDAAIAAYDQLLQANPNDPEALLGKARVYNYANKLDQAQPLYEQIRQIAPTNYSAIVELADVLGRRGNWPASIAMYRQAVQQNPQDLATQVEMARVMRYNHQPADAETVLNNVLQIDARYAPAYAERGILRGEQGDTAAGIADLRQALTITPDDLTAQLGLAEVLGYDHQYAESIRLYQAALQRDPENQKARVELGLVLSYSGNYNEALTQLDMVLKQNPQNESAQIAKAQTLALARRLPESIALYQAVLRTNPENRRAQQGLAEAYVYNHEYDKSIAIYDQLIKADPENVGLQVARARTFGYARQSQRAVNLLRTIVAANPNDTDARLALAEVLTDSGDRALEQQAVAQYQTVLKQAPDNAEAHVGLGRVLSYLGRYPEATAQFNQVLAKQPQNQAALYGLAETQRFSGHPFDAQENYRKVLALNPTNQSAQEALRIVRRQTAPSVDVHVDHFDDSNGVRFNSVGGGPTIPTRAGTIGLTYDSGRYTDARTPGVELRRHAVNLLLAHNFGSLQTRLMLHHINYNSAPSRNLYSLLLQKSIKSRGRIYASIGRREIFESLAAINGRILTRDYLAGVDYPVAPRWDASAEILYADLTDSNTRTTARAALMYRLITGDPALRVGLGVRHEDSKFFSPLYYTPDNFNTLAALADYQLTNGRLRYGLFGSLPLTNRSSTGGNGRPAKTLFGFANYDLSELLEVYLNGGIVRAPNYHSKDITGGVTVRF